MAETLAVKIAQMKAQMDLGTPNNDWSGILEDILEGLQGGVVHQTWTNPDAAAANDAASQKDLDGISEAFSMASPVSPDYPRNVALTAVISNGTLTELTVVVTGVNALGATVTETFTVDDDDEFVGNVAFATITSIAVTALDGDGETPTGASGDTLDAGFGTKFGLLGEVRADCMVKMNEDNDDSGADDVTINATYNTIVFETAPNATHDYDAWYKIEA